MIIVVSPAKSLNEEPVKGIKHTQPRLLDQSEEIVSVMKKRSANDLKKLMGVSDKIAQLNAERYQRFSFPFNKSNAKPAALTFDGDVYTGLNAAGFTEKEMAFAQKHLRILSGLYGVLRPLDLMQAYRLEMGLPVSVSRKKNLYDFWDTQITELINKDLKATGSEILLNLASQEYFKSIKPSVLNAKIVHVGFKEDRNGKLKVISFNAKRARGSMANQIITKGITDIPAVKKLNVDGYKFKAALSDEANLMFVKS